jgi:glycerate 2-kinase
MSALEAAEAIAVGWRAAAPADVVTLAPMADGGPGFVEALHAGLGGTLVEVEAQDPLGRPVTAWVLVVDAQGRRTVYVESAQACGLHLLVPAERDPSRTTSVGVAALLRAALGAGAERIVVGLGGSAINDAGAAMLEELGADRRRLEHIDLAVATDVDSPLLGPQGATAVFGPQKGAAPDALPMLEQRLARFADTTAPELVELPGAGAAGGLGFALFTLGGHRVSGADLVMQALDVDARLAASDLAITGEGALDAQSLRGKLTARVAARCVEAGVPCVAIVGRAMLGRREAAAAGFTDVHSVEAYAGSLQAAIEQGPTALTGLATQVAASWRTKRAHSG